MSGIREVIEHEQSVDLFSDLNKEHFGNICLVSFGQEVMVLCVNGDENYCYLLSC